MKVSAILGLKSLASKIHRPLPLNPRDSQKLLHLLNASFRQQLDGDRLKSSSDEGVEFTDSHFKSILDSPLFSRPNGSQKTLSSLQVPPHEGALKNAHQFITTPVEHFRQEVANGVATLETARECLDACMKNMMSSQGSEECEMKASSQIGTAVLHWLWSSGLQQSMEFFADKRFLNVLLPFVVAEGQTSAFWQWFRALESEMKTDSSEKLTVPLCISTQSFLVKEYIVAQVKYGGGPGVGLAEFLKVIDQVSSNSIYTRNLSWVILELAGLKLVSSLRKWKPISMANVSDYTKLQKSTRIWTPRKQLFDVILSLHHPLLPDPIPALNYIRRLGPEVRRSRRIVLRLCLDTAHMLSCTSRQADALWVMNFIQHNFAKEVGSKQHHSAITIQSSDLESTNIEIEAANLRLQEDLALNGEV